MRRLRLEQCLLLCVLAGCTDTGRDTGPTGGTMVIVSPANANTLLPPIVVDIVARQVTDLIYERLAEIGPELNTLDDRTFEPQIARSWTWSDDSLAIAFAIDPDAQWHDGWPVRASDVRFSLALTKDPSTVSPNAALLTNVDSVSVRDSLTAVAWFHKRTPEQFYDFVHNVRILPEHVLKDVPRDQLATSEVTRKPVGSGRFRFARWEPGVRLEIVADTGHYRGRPRLDRIVWSFVPDGSAALTQLFTGQADFFENLPPDAIPRLDSTGNLRAVPYAGFQYSFMGFNQKDRTRRGTPHPIFADVRVRRALSMALDRDAMLRNVFDTLGVLGSGPSARSYAFSDTTLTHLPFDRGHAAALLDTAGWVAGADGMRSRDGRPLAFTLLVPNSSRPRMRYAVLIQEQLKSVGAKVNIDAIGFAEFIPRQDAGNFDAALQAFGPEASVVSSRETWGTRNPGMRNQNFLGFSNATFDAEMDTVAMTFDPTRARQHIRRAFQAVVDDAPAVWLYDVLNVAGAHRRIRPEGMRADAWWANLADWWIPADERIERDRIGLSPAQP